ncbi:lytic transglycosylase domain-containing protein [Yoonia sp. 208BN28-4]|uniref:lytic transglycosylase domain-containing protein n=1 Tax=Yoonia sp. 208BN28-4 TaxID=3126505 RepID=UPI0030A65172
MKRIWSIWLFCIMPFGVAAQTIPDGMTPAIDAAADADYAAAMELAEDDPLMQDVVQWIMLREGDGSFAQYRAFLAARPDWPDQDRIRARAEVDMPSDLAPSTVLDWFADAVPQTGQGAVRLAEALIAQGQQTQAEEVLVTAWLELTLTETAQALMLSRFGDVLAPHHEARTDALLWRWRTTAAQRMVPLLDDDQVALLRARVGYIRNTGDVATRVAAVPDELADTPGFAYDRYNWLADKGDRTEAIAILKERSVSAAALGEPFRWSGWRRSLARWEMREGRIASAYALASDHFLTEGSAYADLEWLAGYLSLTYLNKPAQALAHFENFAAAVDSPISEGRAGYWIGRTHEALGDANAAAAAYAEGGQYQTGFYGLLAAEKLGLDYDPALSGASDATDWQGAAVMEDDMIRAAIALIDANERGLAIRFVAQLGRTLDADGVGRFGAWLQDNDESYYAVLLGKAAALRGVVVPSVYFPLHDMTQMDLPVPMSLALSIARRESEFNTGAGSPVGAQGLMQLMPATAREVSNGLALPYTKARLTSDWEYNAILGAQYLAGLRDQFGYSPVQMAAGYNAGPSRPLRWMDERGDPRLGEVDVVDWIEHIPFRETRNYAMRVTESIPVYEARLNGLSGPVQFRALLIGAKPLIRPRARDDGSLIVEPAAISTSTAPAVAAPPALPRPSGVQGIRPISRPGG